MIILWIRKKQAEDARPKVAKNTEDTFQKHDEIMKRFRLAHPDVNIVHTRDFISAEESVLAPLSRIKLAEHVQN